MKDGPVSFSEKKISLIQILSGIFLLLILIYPAMRFFVFPSNVFLYATQEEACERRELRNICEYIRWIGFSRLELTESTGLEDYISSLLSNGLPDSIRIECDDTTDIEVIPVSEELKKVYIIRGNNRREVFVYGKK